MLLPKRIPPSKEQNFFRRRRESSKPQMYSFSAVSSRKTEFKVAFLLVVVIQSRALIMRSERERERERDEKRDE